MSEIVVKPVTTRRQRRAFVGFPWRLYQNDPNWVPPLLDNHSELLGYRPHPLWEENEIQTFLAQRRGDVCGRIAAVFSRGHIEKYKERRGYFGFFECVDDQAVADALFDAAKGWLAERDVHAMRGPTNPAMMYEIGLLVEGFDSPPTFLMTYNPPYYGRLIENCGFRKIQDLYSYAGHVSQLPAIHAKLGPIGEKVREYCDVHIRPLNPAKFMEDVEAFLDVFNRSLINHWGYVPMSDAEIRHMAKGLRWLIVPELVIVAEVDGKMVGSVFTLPDYNPRIKRINGRLFPFGFLRLLRGKHRIKRVRMLSTNVLPEYQRMGVPLCLLAAMMPKALEWGIEEAEFSWVAESNALSRGSLQKAGLKCEKTFRVYDLD
ncbi:MAG: N-acetyltransferase [Rhodopirellula sp.]|nr:N-acetyltransferase [Rhodopirellula sp.]